MNVNLRKAEMSDFKAIHELLVELTESDANYDRFASRTWVESDDAKGYISDHISLPDMVCFVAEENGKIIAYATGAHVDFDLTRPVKRTEIGNMFVKKEYRNQGIGKKLFEEVKKWSKEQGAEVLMVDVYAKNSEAIDFYKKLNFVEDSIQLETILE